MENILKRYERFWFSFLLIAIFICACMSLYCFVNSDTSLSKWITTTGLISTVAGVIQLEISGLFKKILAEYENTKKYPYGPPSYITREIIDNPDAPIRSWIKDICFNEPRMGFWLIIGGTLIQVLGVWS